MIFDFTASGDVAPPPLRGTPRAAQGDDPSPSMYSIPHRRLFNIRIDLAIGIGVALLIHLGLFLSSFWSPSAPPKPVVAEVEPVIQLELPPYEPDKPVVTEEETQDSSSNQLAPPTLEDYPMVVPIDAFVQPVQPPAPAGITGQAILTIPKGPPGNGHGHGMGQVFDVGSLDQPPMVQVRYRPVYPPDLRRRSVAGEVTVEFTIDVAGRVRSVNVISATDPAFEASVQDALPRWRFRPGRKNGRPVNTRVQQVIAFGLDDM